MYRRRLRAEQREERLLRSFHREEEVVAAIDHQRRLQHVRREVERIDLRQRVLGEVALDALPEVAQLGARLVR